MPDAKLRLNRGETGRLPLAADVGKQGLSRPIPLAGVAGTIGNVSVMMAEFERLLAWGPEAPERRSGVGLGNPGARTGRPDEQVGRTGRAKKAAAVCKVLRATSAWGQEGPCPWLKWYPSIDLGRRHRRRVAHIGGTPYSGLCCAL